MDRISTAQAATMPVEFKLNGRTVVGRSDETLIETAKHYGIDIPHLCYKEGMRPDGNCRACVVEIKGERVLAPSCCRYPKDGMEVTTDNPRSVASQKMVLELLLSDIPEKSRSEEHTSELQSQSNLVCRLLLEKKKKKKIKKVLIEMTYCNMLEYLNVVTNCV